MLTTSPNITSGEWVARCGSGGSGGSGGAALVDPVLGDCRSGSRGVLVEWVARCGSGSEVSGGSGGAALVNPVLGDWRSGSGGALIVGSEEGAGR